MKYFFIVYWEKKKNFLHFRKENNIFAQKKEKKHYHFRNIFHNVDTQFCTDNLILE